jgi:hypothetical protein
MIRKVNIMNALTVLVVGGPLLLMAGLPAMADHPTPLLVNGTLLKLADDGDFAAHKDAYVQKMHNEMAEWRRKMHAGGERTEAEVHGATERASRKLQAESAEGWNKTKTAYERSTAQLRMQWHKLHPEDQD